MERGKRIELSASAWKAEVLPLYEPRINLVGVTRFEHATTWSQTRSSTRLSYTPLFFFLILLIYKALYVGN